MNSMILALANRIRWQGNWAFSCDFPGNDINDVHGSSEECGEECSRTPECTHFTWTAWQDGTCWLKKGVVSKSQAIQIADKTQVCGIISDSEPSDPPLTSTSG
ncbi:unnamed protein product [Rotaria sp. Silwood1]|nr:unnamed protein product [Rotaria sp. Silwood1]CAF4998145.1 unnamed protein product [Rotaria sp. Silwood1]